MPTPAPMMKCGHRANATETHTGLPGCAICVGIHPGATVVDDAAPSLEGRTAKCSCGVTRPSTDPNLAFFEYRGAGSRVATDSCGVCGYAYVAHTVEGMARNVPSNRRTVVEQGKCAGFEPHGPWEFDSFYCGHSGWD